MTESELRWAKYYFDLLNIVKTKSKDTSTKVGAIIVGQHNEVRSMGFNSPPRKVNDNIAARLEYPAKASFVEHAERNAIYNAARVGIPTNGCTIFIPFLPCPDCARAVIQAGIIKIIYSAEQNERWKSPKYTPELMAYSLEMLSEAEIELIAI